MFTVYLRDSAGGYSLFGQAETRAEWVRLRQAAGAIAKARGLNGTNVSGYTPCGALKLGIHGYK